MYREKALDLCLRIYGEKNIHTAGIYHNLGTEYTYEDSRQVIDNDTLSTYDITNSQKGLEYLVKSLKIKKELAPHNLLLFQEVPRRLQDSLRPRRCGYHQNGNLGIVTTQ